MGDGAEVWSARRRLLFDHPGGVRALALLGCLCQGEWVTFPGGLLCAREGLWRWRWVAMSLGAAQSVGWLDPMEDAEPGR